VASNTLNILKPSVNNLTVRIFVRAAGLDFEELDVWGKTTTPEYMQKYPAHLTPMLEEEGLPKGALGESCAIMAYLCNKHGLTQFYPEDPGERAMIDNAMFYLIGTLYPLLTRATYPTLGFAQYPGEVGTSDADDEMTPKPRSPTRSTSTTSSSSQENHSSAATSRQSPTFASPRRSSSCARSTTTSRPGPTSTCNGWRRRSARRTRSRRRTSVTTSPT
jgi:hypothetical protein